MTTLMFNNSGMAQFKEYFLGNAVPKSNRITDTQNVFVFQEKHNDLEDVGLIPTTYHVRDARNWSFFLIIKEALPWAWEFLTE
jgi:alanyl-tRNA synthetase